MMRQIMGMKNTYTIYKFVDGKKEVLAHFHNLITARMRQQLAASNGMRIHSIWFGNGSQEPSEADTALTSPLWTFSWNYGNIISVQKPEPDTDNSWNIRCTAKIDATSEFVGTVSEIGIYLCTGNPGLGMGTHALIKDAEGNPMTITKTDTEVLYVDIHIKYTFTTSCGFEWTPWYYYLLGEGASASIWPYMPSLCSPLVAMLRAHPDLMSAGHVCRESHRHSGKAYQQLQRDEPCADLQRRQVRYGEPDLPGLYQCNRRDSRDVWNAKL